MPALAPAPSTAAALPVAAAPIALPPTASPAASSSDAVWEVELSGTMRAYEDAAVQVAPEAALHTVYMHVQCLYTVHVCTTAMHVQCAYRRDPHATYRSVPHMVCHMVHGRCVTSRALHSRRHSRPLSSAAKAARACSYQY